MSNYANIVKSADNESTTTANVIKHVSDERDCESVLPAKRRLVVNYVPPRGSSSYDSWEFSYYRHLRALSNIFIEEMGRDYPELRGYLSSAEFFTDFCHMVREGSSGYISPYLEDLTEYEEEEYWDYLIKRNES